MEVTWLKLNDMYPKMEIARRKIRIMQIKIKKIRYALHICNINLQSWGQKSKICRLKGEWSVQDGDRMRQNGNHISLYGSRPRRICTFWYKIGSWTAGRPHLSKKHGGFSVNLEVWLRLGRGLTSRAGALWYTSVTLSGHSGVTLGPLRDHLGHRMWLWITLKSLWDHFGMTFGAWLWLWDHFGGIWGHFCATWGSFWGELRSF